MVIPAFNEEQSVPLAAAAVVGVLKDAGIPYELIFVDDGSKDGTWEEIRRAAEAFPGVRGLRFSRNFGKEAAIFAGLAAAAGSCCAVMDCDLQHPPEKLADMYRLWQQGYQVVEGVKVHRGKESPLRAAAARTFYAIISRATGIDMSRAWFASRYDKGTADYINCALTKEEYLAFWRELCAAQEAEVHGFEDKNVFEGCMPVEVMARRGEDTLRYGPLKPRGLRDPATGEEPYAVVQLRRDNAQGSIYNLVGFQTHLKFGEQKRVFSMIPALRNAEYLRYGVMHRNTYLDSPRLLDRYYRLKSQPRVAFAGQMTGVEGYVESAASGFLAGVELARRLRGMEPLDLPRETAIGALALYISDGTVEKFQPMNVNFGIITPLGYRVKGKRNKNAEISHRSLRLIEERKEEILR